MKRMPRILTLSLLATAVLLLWHTVFPITVGLRNYFVRKTPPSNPESQVALSKVSKTTPTASSGLTMGKSVEMANLLRSKNHSNIQFYGKVIDQDTMPIAGVIVYASVIYNDGFSEGVSKKQTTTDVDGLFTISGIEGRTLGIGLKKDGFEYGGDNGPFHYTELVSEAMRHHPQKDKPVAFAMMKLQGADPIVFSGPRWFDIVANGTPLRVDLATGQKVSTGGDVLINLQQPMAQPGNQLLRYPWSIEISANGLSESTSTLMYRAPESGYLPILTYGERGDERVQSNHVAKRLFLRTSNGRYARIRIDVTSRTNPEFPSTVGLTWWLNPKPGSRNLEFDPAKSISLKP